MDEPGRTNLLAYRQMHEQTNVAATVLTAMAEMGRAGLDVSARGQELMFHGLLQNGIWRDASGAPLRKALRYAADLGVYVSARRDAQRIDHLRELLTSQSSGFEFRLPEELGATKGDSMDIERDSAGDNRVLLVEISRMANPVLHVLLVRRVEGRHYSVMDSANGRNYDIALRDLKLHIITPVSHGPVAFAGALYAFTGIAFVLSRTSSGPAF